MEIVSLGSFVVKTTRECYARRMLMGLRSLFFPVLCLECPRPVEDPGGLPLCPECARRLPCSRPPWCLACGCSLAGTGAGVDRCRDCRLRQHSFPFEKVVTPFLYEGAVPRLVWLLKYQARLSFVPALADWMAQALRQRVGHEPADLCLPVPLHSTRLRERTFNQSERLGRALAQKLRLPFRPDLLVRRRATLSQTDLPRPLRRINLQGAFSVRLPSLVQGSRILLVDDIFTTGSTAGACAQALKQAGAERVFVAAIAQR